MPKRVQMTRKKGGWRKDHPDAVVVSRPGKYGNPFEIGPDNDRASVVYLYEQWMLHDAIDPLVDKPDITALRGKDLACWCPLDEPCHADVLLEISNRPLATI